MFWKKKQMTTTPAGVTSATEKPEVSPASKAEKYSGPKELPELVGRHLVTNMKKDPDWVWHLKAVVRESPKAKKAFEVRVFDEASVAQQKVKVKDWTTFDQHPNLIMYEGWFDKEALTAELEAKK